MLEAKKIWSETCEIRGFGFFHAFPHSLSISCPPGYAPKQSSLLFAHQMTQTPNKPLEPTSGLSRLVQGTSRASPSVAHL